MLTISPQRSVFRVGGRRNQVAEATPSQSSAASSASTTRSLQRSQTRKTKPVSVGVAEQARIDQFLAEEIECFAIDEFQNPRKCSSFLTAMPRGERNSGSVAPPSGTPIYLAQLYAIPLLTPEQEFHQFRKMHFLRFQAAQIQQSLRANPAQPGLVHQGQKLLEQSEQVRNEIVRSNLRLVVSIAKTVVDPVTTLDEAISDGHAPLIRAVEIFDYRRGLRFSTYATWAIRNCLYRSVPRNRKLSRRFATGVDEGWQSFIIDTETNPHQNVDGVDAGAVLKELVDALPERDREIVQLRFGLTVPRPWKFREIAERLEISTERVRQLLARAVEQLRERLQRDPRRVDLLDHVELAVQ
jgi:RNA polymerase primary sigma factor